MTLTSNITEDYFLGQNLRILQPAKGYRAGIDALLLGVGASYLAAQNVCELGSGVGVATFCNLSMRRGNLPKRAQAIEIDETAFELFKINARNNCFEFAQIAHLDGLSPNSEFENQFDLVFSNPPYFDDDSAIRNPHESRTKAYIIGAPLLAWIKAMLRLAKSGGRFLMVHRADRTYDIIHALQGRAGDIRILPIMPKSNENANRVLISAKKHSRAPLQILPPVILRDANIPDQYLPKIDAMCKGDGLSEFERLWR